MVPRPLQRVTALGVPPFAAVGAVGLLARVISEPSSGYWRLKTDLYRHIPNYTPNSQRNSPDGTATTAARHSTWSTTICGCWRGGAAGQSHIRTKFWILASEN